MAVARQLDRKLQKRYQWVAVHDNLCTVETLDYRACCDEGDSNVPACEIDPADGTVVTPFASPWQLDIIPPAPPQATYTPAAAYEKDTLTVVAFKGVLTFCPILTLSADTRNLPTEFLNVGIQNDYANANYIFRAALSKEKWIYNAQTDSYAPPDRDPLRTEEWSDARFLKQWERRHLQGYVGQSIQLEGLAPRGCYGDVSAAGAGAPANTLSSGSGTVNIPAISTTAADCPATLGTFQSFIPQARYPGCFRIPFNFRRRLVFKENEGLTFWFNWTSHRPQGPAGSGEGATVPLTFKLQASVKALLEVA